MNTGKLSLASFALFLSFQVWCDLDDSSALTGGGWTTVFRRSAAVAFSAETEPAKWEAYEFGFGDNTTDNYFIGVLWP